MVFETVFLETCLVFLKQPVTAAQFTRPASAPRQLCLMRQPQPNDHASSKLSEARKQHKGKADSWCLIQ